MMGFIPVAQTDQHLQGVFLGGFFHKHRRKPALESRVFFNMFLVLIQGGCAYTLQLTARQGGF